MEVIVLSFNHQNCWYHPNVYLHRCWRDPGHGHLLGVYFQKEHSHFGKGAKSLLCLLHVHLHILPLFFVLILLLNSPQILSNCNLDIERAIDAILFSPNPIVHVDLSRNKVGSHWVSVSIIIVLKPLFSLALFLLLLLLLFLDIQFQPLFTTRSRLVEKIAWRTALPPPPPSRTSTCPTVALRAKAALKSSRDSSAMPRSQELAAFLFISLVLVVFSRTCDIYSAGAFYTFSH